MTIDNPYPFVSSVKIEIEASQLEGEMYCVPNQIRVVSVVGDLRIDGLRRLARRRGFGLVEEMILHDHEDEIEEHVIEHSHEFLQN